MARTARAIITSALKKIGAIASGETPTSAELQDGLASLQGLLDTWSNNDLLTFVETEESFNLIPGQQEYTIGTNGNFATTRPMEILALSVVDANGFELPIRPLKFELWVGQGLRTTQSSFPTEYYYRTGYPLGKIMFSTVPTEAREIVIYSRKPIVTIANVNSTLDLPPGYDDAIIYNLALELVDDYGGQVSPLTLQKAGEKLDAIKTQNLSKNIPYMSSESELSGKSAQAGSGLGDLLKGGN